MKYTEFRDAAERHLHTCQKLKGVLEGELGKKEKENVLKNLFYLTGYIVECSFKFAFFAKLRKEVRQSRNDDVTFLVSVYSTKIRKKEFKKFDENGKEINFRYKKHFSLQEDEEKDTSYEIIAYIKDRFRPTPASDYYEYLISNSTNGILAPKWHSETRYFIDFELNQNEVIDYLKDAERIFLTSKKFDKSPKYS